MAWRVYWKPESTEAEITLQERFEALTKLPALREAYIEAHGGRKSIESFNTVKATGVLESDGEARPFLVLKKRPDQALLRIEMPDYELTIGVSGDTVWQRTIPANGGRARYRKRTGKEARMLGNISNFYDPLTEALVFGRGEVRSISRDQWEEQPALRVDFVTAEGLDASAYLDPRTTFALARMDHFADGRQRRTIFDNYRRIGGLPQPFEITTFLDGTRRNKMRAETFEHNVGVVSSIFQMPKAPKADRSPVSASD